MLALADRYPEDDDIQTLAAEAVMDTSPWNYWEADKRTPLPLIGEAIKRIEAVLARNPDHVQAAHLYIHLLEASDPQRAEAVAERLTASTPSSAGHLVHMPGHIFMRRGRMKETIEANRIAARADETFITDTGDESLVRYGYYPHNLHFIVAAAQLAGDMDTALAEASNLRRVLDVEASLRLAWVQLIDAAPYQALSQFAEPAAILSAPAPDERLSYARAMHHYARATAYARRQDRTAFERELQSMTALMGSANLVDMAAQGLPANDLVRLADLMARARYASVAGQHDQAITLYEQALIIEANLPYQEPALWPWPVRQSLGAELLMAGRPDEAAATLRLALIQTPDNGWLLYGLAEAETARGNRQAAAEARKAFRQAWLGNPRWLKLDHL